MNRGILIVPAFEHGRGGGHLTRCAKLTIDLRVMKRDAWLYLPLIRSDIEKLFKSMNFNMEWLITEAGLQDVFLSKIECIVMDRFQTSKDELFRWKKIAPVVGIDEGGGFRAHFDFLVDILIPEKLMLPPANITSPSLLNYPSRTISQKQNSNDKIKVLISFGHEDTAGLGLSVSQKLIRQNNGSLQITFLSGELSNNLTGTLQNISIIKNIPQLAEHLGEYDIVITHYGITAYEALYAGTSVLLVNPTSYHEKLSKAAGFYTTANLPKINQTFLQMLKKHCKKLSSKLGLDKECKTLAGLVHGFSPQINRSCPVCGMDANEKNLARFTERTYRRCRKCGIIYMDRTCHPPFEYGQEYFFEMYRKQYGKTYIEDFPNLINMSKRRLLIIKSLLAENTKEPRLLDIGCAYGPFLAAAREEGFSPSGLDPSQDAVSYVNEKLKIPASAGFFPNAAPPVSGLMDAITLWFVMEHFQNCIPVLAEINKLLRQGGILAFSTPSFSGISGRKSLKRFLENSPSDHYTIWSPKMCKKALALYGFKVKKIVITGHHGERFPLLGKFANSNKSPLHWLFLVISKLFRLGDTFEVYAVKN